MDYEPEALLSLTSGGKQAKTRALADPVASRSPLSHGPASPWLTQWKQGGSRGPEVAGH